jgi:IS30 family transposase
MSDYKHFTIHTIQESYIIDHLLHFGSSYREIERRFNRHHTAINREAKSNGHVFAPYWNEEVQ